MKRKLMPMAIHRQTDTASKVDVMGISLTDFLAEAMHDRNQALLRKVLLEPDTRVRVILLNPQAPYLRQRSVEDGDHSFDSLLNRQNRCIEYCVQLYSWFDKHYQAEKLRNPHFEPRGTLVVRLIEACPYISYERYDFHIYWGLYTSDSPGQDAPVFLTTSKEGELYEKLKSHFSTLLHHGYEEVTRPKEHAGEDGNTLLTVTHKGPWLNEKLVTRLLGTNPLQN
jgi:hypothetical protein